MIHETIVVSFLVGLSIAAVAWLAVRSRSEADPSGERSVGANANLKERRRARKGKEPE